MALGEFDLIRRYFSRPAHHTVLGVGDDAALIAPTAGMQLAVAADTMVEGRHFFAGTDPYALGWKVLAVNLSDMAAMGAKPRWATLCLTLPTANETWLDAFAAGFYTLAEQSHVDLIGGDTTRGPLAFSVQIIGEVAPGQALRRDGARVGDDVWISGPTGIAALAVRHRNNDIKLLPESLAVCAEHLDLPKPRLALGDALRGVATAAIDVSDGLLADLGHIGECSGLGARIQPDLLPPWPIACSHLPASVLRDCQLAGGDDYELCFTAPAASRDTILTIGASLGLPLTRIGMMVAEHAVVVVDTSGQQTTMQHTGFNHFEEN